MINPMIRHSGSLTLRQVSVCVARKLRAHQYMSLRAPFLKVPDDLRWRPGHSSHPTHAGMAGRPDRREQSQFSASPHSGWGSGCRGGRTSPSEPLRAVPSWFPKLFSVHHRPPVPAAAALVGRPGQRPQRDAPVDEHLPAHRPSHDLRPRPPPPTRRAARRMSVEEGEEQDNEEAG